ncbi:MAG: Uma2 family endonuclease [Chloroflexi bacterium]|nr:Uma2 family endonuclease [Chloroflexota bacterium]
MPDGDAYELIDGELRERNVSAESSRIAANVTYLLVGYAQTHGGMVFATDLGLKIFPGRPNHVPRPDGSFVAAGRVHDDVTPSTGFLEIVPDLVVEVVSPNDTAYGLDAKVRDYLGVGVRLVWVAYPEARYVMVWRADGSLSMVGNGDMLRGEDVLPGFETPVAELFPKRAAVAPVESAGS